MIVNTHFLLSSKWVVLIKVVGIHELDNTSSTDVHIAALTKQAKWLVKAQVKEQMYS